MNRLATLVLLATLASALPARAGQYETVDYYVQQMIALSVANDETGVQTFREQLDNLRRPEAGDAAQAQPLRQQGLEYLNHDQLKEALVAFRQAFIADPADPEIAGQLGLTYLRLRRLKEAERLLVYALALAPARSDPWLRLGQVYGQSGDATAPPGRSPTPTASPRTGRKWPGSCGNWPRPTRRTPSASAPCGRWKRHNPRPLPDRQPPPIHPLHPRRSSPVPFRHPARAGNRPHRHATGRERRPVRFAAAGLVQSGEAHGRRHAHRRFAPNPGGGRRQSGTADLPRQHSAHLSDRHLPQWQDRHLGQRPAGLADGQVITNNHVIENAQNLVVKCGQRESVARVGKRSKEPDLALLTTSLNNAESFVLDATYSQGLIGLEVFVIGNPYGLEGTFSTGVISGLRNRRIRDIQISAPISPGNSGGPVILRDGSVIGITTMGLKKGQNLNFAIAAAEVIRSGLLDPAG